MTDDTTQAKSNASLTPDHHLSARDANVHYACDNSLTPVLRVEPGDVVRFECRDATDGQLGVDATNADVYDLDFPGHPLTGPVAVNGAEPGDVLEVELLSLQHKGFGVTYFYDEEKGLLPELFDEPFAHVWNLEDDVGRFVDGIEVPLAPFPGNLGVAPAERGEHSTVPPRNVGGNLDVKHLTAGSTLWLPIAVGDALFSIGDCHAAQGDGEVCVTGIEAPMSVTARFDVRSDRTLDAPQFETAGPFTPTGRDERMYATTGVADDLMEATRRAVTAMIDHLHEKRGLSRAAAYALCSAVVDCKLSQVVNTPNWTVTAYLPESIFPA